MSIHRAKTKAQYKKWIEACFQYALEFDGDNENVKIGSITVKSVSVSVDTTPKGNRIYGVAMEHENSDREFVSFLESGKVECYYYWGNEDSDS